MNRRGRLNLVLLGAAVALGVGVFFSREEDKKGPPLTALKPDQVTRVVVSHPGAAALRLEKRDGRWYMTDPVQAEVDEFEVNALLGLAENEAQETVTGASLAELELDPPKYTVQLDDVTIAVGGVEPLQYRRYVKVGETVSLIEDPPSAALDQEYADLIAKDLLPKGAEIERIELPKLALARAGDRWALTPPDPTAGADQMQKLADGWRDARSMWNEMAKDAPVKGDKVRITLKDGSTREFVVAAREPQLKLHRAELGVNFVMSKALVESLLQLPPPAPKEDPVSEPVTPAGPAATPPAPAEGGSPP